MGEKGTWGDGVLPDSYWGEQSTDRLDSPLWIKQPRCRVHKVNALHVHPYTSFQLENCFTVGVFPLGYPTAIFTDQQS